MQATLEMNNSTDIKKRIIKNTGFLYIRMFFVTLISLYTSRVTIEALGVKDYGIYTLVGGFVAVFMAFANLMTGATQRFLNYSIGQEDYKRINKVFSTSVLIHVSFAIAFIVLGETMGLWFVTSKLNIPEDSKTAALIVYQFALGSMALSITQVPYMATIIAYERMSFYSIMGIIEICLKLGFTVVLLLLKSNVLIIYAGFMFLLSVGIRVSYNIYVRHKFRHIKLSFCKDIPLIKEMASFAGWSFLGTASYVSINQAIPIILNLFFGVVVNAAMGLANQISGTVNQFVSSFQTAFKPQIVKLYAKGEVSKMLSLLYQASKLSFFLMLVIISPAFPVLGDLLRIWLPTVPEYTLIFCKLVLIYCLIDTLTIPIWTAIEATGKIRSYQLYVGLFFLLYIPFSYLLLKLGYSAYSILWLKIIMSIIIHSIRVVIIKSNIPEFSYIAYLSKVIAPIVIISCISLGSQIILNDMFNEFLIAISVFIVTCASVISIGLSSNERHVVISLIARRLKK